MNDGNIVISPFDERNLSTSSYDVTLGEFYFRPKRQPWSLSSRADDMVYNVYNIYSQENMEHVFGNPQQALTVEETLKMFPPNPEVYKSQGISKDDKVIMLAPGETILAHTNEFIGGRDHITTMMKARSSVGRSFIGVCKCAGWGDVGFINRWTLEITNYSVDYWIPLVVGRRIAQIVFFDTGPILGIDYAVQGKYQTSDMLSDLQKNWKPEDMLPRLYKDRDIK